MNQFDREYDRIRGIIGLTYEQKRDDCDKIFDFFQRLCTMTDIAFSIFQSEGASIPYYVCSLTLRNYLEIQACLLEGAYPSAARSLRWLFEINVVGTTACVDASLLDTQNSSGPFDLEEFERLLEKVDEGKLKITRGKRKEIFDQFSLPSDDLALLYSDLCKYVHLSQVSFDKTFVWPNLQYIPEKFDEIFQITLKTLDLIFWIESRMLLCFDKGTAQALKYFLRHDHGLNQYLPLTVSLISSLK